MTRGDPSCMWARFSMGGMMRLKIATLFKVSDTWRPSENGCRIFPKDPITFSDDDWV